MSAVRTDRPAARGPRVRNAAISVPRGPRVAPPRPAPPRTTAPSRRSPWTTNRAAAATPPPHHGGPSAVFHWLARPFSLSTAAERASRVARAAPVPDPAAAAAVPALWLASVLDALDDGILLIDASGRVVLANAALRRLSGFDDALPPTERPPACQVARRLRSALRPLDAPDHAAGPQSPAKILRQVASPHRVLERREVIQRAADGTPLGSATIYRDITERRAERARNDRFLANVAHELRTPLTCITGHAGLLDQRLPGLAQAHPDEATTRRARETTSRSLRAIRRQVARMDRLLGDVLDTAQLERGMLTLQVEEADVAALLRSLIDDIADMAPKHHFDLDAPIALMARCDPTRLEHIVYNLLSNATRFSPAGGTIRVILRADADPDDPSPAGRALVLLVGDDGPGIPPESSERIFDRYDSQIAPLSRDVPGLGIRLSISRALAERHGGSLRVLPPTPDHPRGGTFELRLPLA